MKHKLIVWIGAALVAIVLAVGMFATAQPAQGFVNPTVTPIRWLTPVHLATPTCVIRNGC